MEKCFQTHCTNNYETGLVGKRVNAKELSFTTFFIKYLGARRLILNSFGLN